MNSPILDTSCQWNHWYFSFCLWLISLNIIFWRFTHVVACVKTSFFSWLNNIPLYGYTNVVYPVVLMDTWVVSTFWLLWSICSSPCFQFFWVCLLRWIIATLFDNPYFYLFEKPKHFFKAEWQVSHPVTLWRYHLSLFSVVCWNWLVLAPRSQLLASLSKSTFSDVMFEISHSGSVYPTEVGKFYKADCLFPSSSHKYELSVSVL